MFTLIKQSHTKSSFMISNENNECVGWVSKYPKIGCIGKWNWYWKLHTNQKNYIGPFKSKQETFDNFIKVNS